MNRKTVFVWLRSKKNWFYAIFACVALMLIPDAESGSSYVTAESGMWNFLSFQLKNLEYMLPVFTYRDALLVFLVICFFHKTDGVWNCGLSRSTYRIPAFLTSFFLVFGYSFYHTNSWNLIFMDVFHRLIALVMLAGFYVLSARIYQEFAQWICTCGEFQKPYPQKISDWILEKHAFWGPFLLILLFWSPYILAKYPGAAMPETLAEMRQYYWNAFNNYYPPLHTVMLGLLMELGNFLNSYTFGFFLNLVAQLALLLSAFSYGFVLMRRWKTPYSFRWFALLIICLVQFFPMEATVVEKDVPYTACVIFLVLQLYEIIRTLGSGTRLTMGQTAGFVLSAMGTACFRNEGFYLVAASGICMVVYAYRKLWKKDRFGCMRIFTAMLLPLVLFAGYQRLLLPLCGVADNGPKEALSIPFQQTARYVRDYGYEMTEEEEEIISRVLDAENLAGLYDPITSDPVKYTYHAETVQDLTDYFGLWFRQLLRHPGNAVQATMNNAYGWFYREGYAHNYMMSARIEGHDVRWEIVQPPKLAGVRQLVERVAKLLSRVPVVNWFENAGFVSWLTIFLTAFWAGAGKKHWILSVVPLIMALLVCVAAPTFNCQMRYIMPVVFSVPYYLPMALKSLED